MKISPEAREAATTFFPDHLWLPQAQDDLAATMQSLINSTLERAAYHAHSAIFDLAMERGPENPASEYSMAATNAIRQLIEE